MKSVWREASRILTGIFVTAVSALPQAYTISAKPGVVNYIEGTVLLNGQLVSGRELKSTFLAANDVLSTEAGKAEVLLAPGVFLRVGDNSQVRMISPSLVDTQLEMQGGEAMIEVDELVKDNRISVVDHGASITIEKTGLYRFTGGDTPTVAAIEGKASVYFGEKKVEVAKGREAELAGDLKVVKFDPNKEDDLYAWSNIRAEYDASAAYQSARNVSQGNYSAFGSGYGSYGGGYGPYGYGTLGSGWLWNSGFNSWAWLPGGGAFFSPFGYGFYGAGLLGYAPVIPVYLPGGIVKTPVPINPKHPPVAPALRSGTVAASPAAYEAARAQVARSYMASGGFHTASGAVAPEFSSPHGASGGHPVARASFESSGGSGSTGGGGGHASGASVGSSGHSSGGSGGGGHSK